MRYLVCGISHHTAPLMLRERLAFAPEEIPQALPTLLTLPDVREAVLLNTCNRVEIVAAVKEPAVAAERFREQLAQQRGIETPRLGTSWYAHADGQAVRHLFRVASSLDAMVVGEAQILGQVKAAYALALAAGTVGTRLHRLFQHSFFVAKRVRRETGIARHAGSVSSVAVELAGRIFDNLATTAVLVLGGGEMAELAIRHFKGEGASRVRIANRTLAHASDVAARLGATAVSWDALGEQLVWADIVLASTASPTPLIDRPLLLDVMRRRKHRPLFMVDIAVPRDIDPAVRPIDGVYLFDLDDLEAVVAENLTARRAEAHAAEQLVATACQRFDEEQRVAAVAPTICRLRQRLVRLAEEEALRRAPPLGFATPATEERLRQLARGIVERLLHEPMHQLKHARNVTDAMALDEAARRLFDLADEERGADDVPCDTSGKERAVRCQCERQVTPARLAVRAGR